MFPVRSYNQSRSTVRRTFAPGGVSMLLDGTATLVRTEDATGDGLRRWVTEFGRTTATSRTYFNDEEEQGISEVTVRPDGSSETRSYSDGLLESVTDSVLGETAYFYDGFGRVESVTHTEGGVEHTTSFTYDGMDRQLTVTETVGNDSRTTAYTFDKLGRTLTETLPGGQCTVNEYDLTGALIKTTGSDGASVYPVSYTYEAGRLKTQTTYRAYPDTPEVYYSSVVSFGDNSYVRRQNLNCECRCS